MIKLSNKNYLEKRILVFGTFDILHKGHLNFFRQARKLAKNVYLIVSVARDVNVKRIKGRKSSNGELKRLKVLRNMALVDRAVLGAKTDYLGHILELRPQIIALGYDQKAYTQDLDKKISKLGLKVKIVRLKSYKPTVYKSSLISKRSVDR